MGFTALFYPWGLVLQAVAILHFIRRRPDTYWLWIILIGGGLGALVYIAAEVVPDADLLRGSLNGVSRRKGIRDLEATIIDNPSIGNLEELDPFYRRGLAALAMGDVNAALIDLQRVVSKEPKPWFWKAQALLARLR